VEYSYWSSEVTTMNLEEWREVGKMAKKIRAAILNELPNYPKNSPIYRSLERAKKSMEVVRDKLDNVVFEQFPEESTEKLAKIFYGEDLTD